MMLFESVNIGDYEVSQVYRLLDTLPAEYRSEGVKLFAMAGKLPQGDGYVFDKASGKRLSELTQVKVFDTKGKLVGTIPHPGLVVEYLYLGKGEFEPGMFYRTKVQTPEPVMEILYMIRMLLLEDLRRYGDQAAREYELAAEEMGGSMTSEEVDAALMVSRE